ncbi:19089_t:CDS:2 [Entrophospora sp. SA101]|nr:19089_t:CDS:2 [Entrophospora sp. SA101]
MEDNAQDIQHDKCVLGNPLWVLYHIHVLNDVGWIQQPKNFQIINNNINYDRKIIGSLKGYDQLLNLVLDETEELLRDPEDNRLSNETRSLGLVVCRGPAVILISPVDGMEEIPNPFLQQE